MATNLRGVMAALLTPFDQQQALDKASLRRLVQFNIQQGIDGLYVGGSTGEAFVQSLSEREQVLEIVAEEAKGKIKLIAHVGCVSTAESQQLAASAKRYGFDAVSAVTPFYYPFSFEEHCDHYRAIIDSADGLPMVVYNIPALSGVKLTLDQINTLVTLPGVGALKQTSGDLYQMEQIRREHPDLVLYNGYDEIFASGLLAGADGGIGSTYNIMGWRYQGIVKALKEGDIQTAQKLQTECNKVIDLLINIPALSGVKLTLDQINTLVTLPGVGALKQTSGDLYQMEQIRREHPDLVLYNGYDEIFASGLLAGADGGIGSTYNIMGWRYQGIVKALKEGDIQTAQKLQTECNKVIDLLIKTGVFRGLKTVLHYMDVVSVPLCRKPFGPVDEKYLPELKALAQQLMQERG